MPGGCLGSCSLQKAEEAEFSVSEGLQKDSDNSSNSGPQSKERQAGGQPLLLRSGLPVTGERRSSPLPENTGVSRGVTS